MFKYLPIVAFFALCSVQALAQEKPISPEEMTARINILADQRNRALDSLVVSQAALAKALDDLKKVINEATICKDFQPKK